MPSLEEEHLRRAAVEGKKILEAESKEQAWSAQILSDTHGNL